MNWRGPAILGSTLAYVGLLDAGVYAALVAPWATPVPAAAAAGLAAWQLRRARRTQEPEPATGWKLGPGEDLANPDHPTPVDPVRLDDAALALGALILGGPGSGKTSACVAMLTHFTQSGTGWLNMDGKGEIETYQKSVAAGAVPDHFFSSELPESESLNLMEGDGSDVADRLSRTIIGTTLSTSYYSDEQRAVLLKVVPVLCGLGLPVNLRDLYTTLCVEDAGAELIALARERGVPEQDRRLAESWLNQDFRERVAKISGMLNKLFPLVQGTHADRINAYTPDISLYDVAARGGSLYCHLPYSEYSRDVAVMIVETLSVIARDRQMSSQDAPQFIQVYDDWGGMFHDGFGTYSARCRSAKMPLFFAFQSKAQADAVSPHFSNELDDNIATKMFLRVNGQATAQWAATLAGEYERTELATSQLGDRGGINTSVARRPRLEAATLRALDPGEGIISTLTRDRHGATQNPLYRARIPAPDTSGYRDVALPDAGSTSHSPADGLGMWDRYMSPERANAIAQEVAAE
jgi:hypothetical protein